ncbi:hypothetical protein EVG20_g11484 [Dentipellis fragilis]|uniref:Uncharacterized protein n=1 Tax=Dentipellis fragilis TaxID=205917 RepID=A0A4Y9XKI1_9AGAM|nr:hypothetical protein EVG20_g11484 [Dentipellis fragilis]
MLTHTYAAPPCSMHTAFVRTSIRIAARHSHSDQPTTAHAHVDDAIALEDANVNTCERQDRTGAAAQGASNLTHPSLLCMSIDSVVPCISSPLHNYVCAVSAFHPHQPPVSVSRTPACTCRSTPTYLFDRQAARPPVLSLSLAGHSLHPDARLHCCLPSRLHPLSLAVPPRVPSWPHGFCSPRARCTLSPSRRPVRCRAARKRRLAPTLLCTLPQVCAAYLAAAIAVPMPARCDAPRATLSGA